MKVKIRYLGSDWWQGSPRQKFIKVGVDIFWNYCRFKEQDADASYTRPMEFYEKHKAILDNEKLFIIDFIEEAQSNESAIGEKEKTDENLEGICQFCGMKIKVKKEQYLTRVLKSHEARCRKYKDKTYPLPVPPEATGE